jgi:subfamily B ATP-binding cassette protein MsbA
MSGREDSASATYLRLLGYMRAHSALMLAGIAMMGLVALSQTSLAAVLKPLMDESFVARDPESIKRLPWIVVGLFMLRGLATFFSTYAMNLVGRNVIKRLRQEVFGQLLHLPVAYYDRNSSASLISRVTYNIEQLAESTTQVVTVLVRDGLSAIGLLSLMIWLNPRLAMFFLVTAPVIAWLVKVVSKRFRRYSSRIQTSMGDVTSAVQEVVSGQRVVKVFGAQDQQDARFEEVNERNRRLHMKLALTKAGSVPIIELLASLGIAGIIYFATLPGQLETITVGTFVAFLSAAILLAAPVKHLTEINAPLQKGVAAAASVFALLDEPREDAGRGRALVRAKGTVAFEAVRFAYSADKGEVLRGVSFEAAAGQTVAIVGRSGSGKSTLVNLVPRFYEPGSGVVRVDGVDVREYALAALRDQIALVSQDVVLFNDTVRANIAYGALAGASDERVLEAAKAAHALEFIDALPGRLDAMVGDRGTLLSGGQRQRIAIARALLKDAPILILDEATSALDTESERHIQQALESLMRGRTTLVIAHRLSTVERADRILVLDRGAVVENGTHAELLKADRLYAALHRMQFQEAGGTGEAGA